jgi:hypothetical protein
MRKKRKFLVAGDMTEQFRDEELHDLCCFSRDVIQVMRGKPCGTYGEKRNGYRILMGKYEGKKTTLKT